MTAARLPALLACAGLALLACDRPAGFDRPLGASPPIGLESHVAWLFAGQPALFTLDPATMRTAIRPLPAPPRISAVAPDRMGLLVLDEQPAAQWIAFDAAGPADPVALPLSAHYSTIVFGPDGRRAVLYQEPGARAGVLTNPNQVAIVDLSTGAVVERTLRSFGDSPQRVVISPPARVAGAERQLAWALSDRYLALIDLAAPEADEVIVHLTLAGDTRSVAPSQVVLADAGEGLSAFVRAEGADDIFALGFDADGDPAAVPRPFLNQLPAGQRPSDLAVLEVDDGVRVFAVEPSLPGLSIIEPITAGRLAVATELPVGRILPFEAPRAEGGTGRFALLWQVGASGVVFADLDRLEAERGRALTPLVIGGGLSAVTPIPGRRAAVARVGESRVVMLDFDARTATPLDADSPVVALVVAPDGGAVHLGTRGGSVAALDTGALTAATVSVTDGWDALWALLHVPGAGRLVAVLRDDLFGRVVVLPDADFDEGDLVRRDALFLEGLFER